MEISAIKCHKCGKYRLTSTLCACEWKAAIDEANAENVKLRMQDIETIRLLRAEVRAWRNTMDYHWIDNVTAARSATDAAGAMGEQR